MKNIIPESWQCLTEEAEDFFNNLANKYIEKSKVLKDLDLIKEYTVEAIAFIYSDTGQEAQTTEKEVVIEILDFLSALTKNNVSDDEIVDIWQDKFYPKLKYIEFES